MLGHLHTAECAHAHSDTALCRSCSLWCDCSCWLTLSLALVGSLWCACRWKPNQKPILRGQVNDPKHMSIQEKLAQMIVQVCSFLCLPLSLLHTLNSTLHYTCYDEIKGIQDLKICSHADSLILSLLALFLLSLCLLSLPCSLSLLALFIL